MPELYEKCPECGGSGADPETPAGWGISCSDCDGTGFVEYTPVLTDNQQFMHLAAFRYQLGRRTYGVGIVADELLRVAEQLDQNTRAIIVREITEAEARDGLGDACDAARWHEVRDRFTELGASE